MFAGDELEPYVLCDSKCISLCWCVRMSKCVEVSLWNAAVLF